MGDVVLNLSLCLLLVAGLYILFLHSPLLHRRIFVYILLESQPLSIVLEVNFGPSDVLVYQYDSNEKRTYRTL